MNSKEINTFDEIATMIKKANDYDVLVNKCKKIEKALDILKNKRVNIPKLLTTTLVVYNKLAILLGYDKLTQEEYELLIEVLENDK